MNTDVQTYEVDYDLTNKTNLTQLLNQLQYPQSSKALFLPRFYFSVINY